MTTGTSKYYDNRYHHESLNDKYKGWAMGAVASNSTIGLFPFLFKVSKILDLLFG